MKEEHYLEELKNIVDNSPVFPGDTISHYTAKMCQTRRWIMRDGQGNWIPTPEGLRVNESQQTPQP